MKKMLALFLTVIVVLICASCGQKEQENPINLEPSLSQMKAICELAVMECYYHNVAKYHEEDAIKGFLGIGSKDKHFWIEYSGVVRLGIDVSLVKIEVDDTEITVTIPSAKVLDCKVESKTFDEDSFFIDTESAEIKAVDQMKAFEEAQKTLKESASANKALLTSAQQRAQELLENYITNIGDAVGEQYTIKWVYVDAEGNLQESVSEPKEPTGEPAA